jgi:Carboxypeptidase regulatory-like domain
MHLPPGRVGLKLDVTFTRRWLARRPLAACAALVLPLALASGGALAAQIALASGGGHGTAAISVRSLRPAVAAHPRLTANTGAACNKPAPKGYARCFAIVRTPASHVVTADSSGPPSGALGPADIQSAYKLPSSTAGGGQTVAIVDAGDDPTAESDLAVFRSQYGLPPCTTANGCFTKVNQSGQQSSYPPVDPGWPTEESLDLDAVSSACPNCNILLVEANSAGITDLGASVDEAITLGAKFVSNSYGASPEPSAETGFDKYYNHPGVAVTASAGDSGWGVNYPSASQYVTAVGGTTLAKDTSVARGWDETVWGSSSGGEGTGSGCSAYEPKPPWQDVTTGCPNRATADVSADANPASGLAIYDTTGEGGWLQVGGTSLSSPLTAATYALAGTPQPGSYPASYPYQDAHRSSDLFDITSGSNGTCGNPLCNAGTGWDGPTGLGTPDGVHAYVSGPHGEITGQVISKTTGKPIAGAAVAANPGGYVTRTDASGDYTLDVAAATYRMRVSDFGYTTGTQSGVTVAAGKTVTENVALIGPPPGTLSGTVTDGSGEGWPLHAQISVEGDPNGPFWASPSTGKYSITLPQGRYTLRVSTDYPGYRATQVKVTVGAATTQNITLDANLAACTAPGYGPDGLAEDFAGWTGGTARDGWAITGHRPGWRFDDPGNVNPPPAGSVPYPPGTSQRMFISFGSDQFAVAGTQAAGPGPVDTTLTSAPVDLAGQSKPEIGFDSGYYPAGRGESAAVQLSVDGGHTWATLWHQATSDALGPVSIPVPQAAGKTGVRVRWVFTGSGPGYWALGSLLIGTPTCVPHKGGLVTGTVTGKSADSPVNGAQVGDAAAPPPYPWPEGMALATADPALAGGFYWLFTPAGSQQLSVAAAGYATASATVNVVAGQVNRHNWTLTKTAGSRS